MSTPSLRQFWRLLSDLLFPPRCISCEQPGEPFCAQCLARIARFPDPRCGRCDLPTDEATATRCERCRRGQFPHLNGMRVLGPHTEPLRSAIHALKYNGRTAIAAPLGRLLAEHWQRSAPLTVDGVLPVPLHPERAAERGFNQAALLATAMCQALALPGHAGLLRRTRATRPQVGLGRQERLRNVSDAFQAAPDAAGGCWLLVDDVCTTGATLQASAGALRAAGARAVWAITLARPHEG